MAEDIMLESIRDRIEWYHYKWFPIPLTAFSILLLNSFVSSAALSFSNLIAYFLGAILFSVAWLNVYHMYKG
jgi:hypothetical protein